MLLVQDPVAIMNLTVSCLTSIGAEVCVHFCPCLAGVFTPWQRREKFHVGTPLCLRYVLSPSVRSLFLQFAYTCSNHLATPGPVPPPNHLPCSRGWRRNLRRCNERALSFLSAPQLFGLTLLFMSLCFDGGTGAYEDKLMNKHHVGPFDLMFNIQFAKMLLAGLGLIVTNQISGFFYVSARGVLTLHPLLLSLFLTLLLPLCLCLRLCPRFRLMSLFIFPLVPRVPSSPMLITCGCALPAF